MAFSPDGKLLASADREGTVSLGEPATAARQVAPSAARESGFLDVAFTPGTARGWVAASAAPGNKLYLWDVEGERERVWTGAGQFRRRNGCPPERAAGCAGLPGRYDPRCGWRPTGAFWVAQLGGEGPSQGVHQGRLHARCQGRYLAAPHANGTLALLRIPEAPERARDRCQMAEVRRCTFCRETAQAVARRLMERNPRLSGTYRPIIKDGSVTELTMVSDQPDRHHSGPAP